MSTELQTALNQARLYEEAGDYENAKGLYLQLLKRTGKNDPSVLFPWAGLLLQSGERGAALDVFISCHKAGFRREEIEEIVTEVYYQPNQEYFSNIYEENVNFLSKYEKCEISCFPDFSSLHYQFVPYSEGRFAVFDSQNRSFLFNVDFSSAEAKKHQKKSAVFMNNQFNLNVIDKYLSAEDHGDKEGYDKMLLPLYLAYDDEQKFLEFLQVCYFPPLLKNNRCVFLFGFEKVDAFFSQPDVVYPLQYLNVQGSDDPYVAAIEGQRQKKIMSGEIDYQNLMLFFQRMMKAN